MVYKFTLRFLKRHLRNKNKHKGIKILKEIYSKHLNACFQRFKEHVMPLPKRVKFKTRKTSELDESDDLFIEDD